MNIISKIQEFASRDAICFVDKVYTYLDLYEAIQTKIIEIDQHGIKQGEVVFILGDYSVESVSWLFALQFNRNIVVPVTTEVFQEIQDRLEEGQADVIINLRTQTITRPSIPIMPKHPLVEEIQQKKISGLIIFSSGSTGKPKAMLHDMDNLMSVYLNKRARPMSFMIFLMFDHIGGLNTLFNCLATGAKVVFPQKREPEEVCRLIEQYKVQVLPTSPTFLNLMLMSGGIGVYDLSSLRMITYGTEAMPESLLRRLKATFGRVKFLQTFGTSETGIAKTSSQSSNSTYIKMDDPDQEYKIVQGELWLRSKTQILGYMNHSMDSFTDDGWFKTGDMVVQDGEYIKIKGRLKEVINVGGEKVLPTEVESVLLEHPDVLDCTVYGAQNQITGQTVVANVRVLEGLEFKQIKKDLKKHCKTKLEAYKVPTKFIFVNQNDFTERFKKRR